MLRRILAMMVNKVELCRVNTSKLPLLKEEEKAEMSCKAHLFYSYEEFAAVT